MITQAIEKITAEANKIKGDTAQVLGEYLIDHMSDGWAEKVLQQNKTLEGAIKSITDKARAKAVAGAATVRDGIVFAWLREYYGLSEGVDETNQKAAAPELLKQDKPVEPEGLNVNIFDLL